MCSGEQVNTLCPEAAQSGEAQVTSPGAGGVHTEGLPESSGLHLRVKCRKMMSQSLAGSRDSNFCKSKVRRVETRKSTKR